MFVPYTRAAIRHMPANRQGGIMKVKSRIDSIETMSNEEVLQYAEILLIRGSVDPILYSMTDRREMAQFLIRLYMYHQESCKNFLQKKWHHKYICIVGSARRLVSYKTETPLFALQCGNIFTTSSDDVLSDNCFMECS